MEQCGFYQSPHGKSATAANLGADSTECSSGGKLLELSPNGRNGYDPREEPCGFHLYPHGESFSSTNLDSLTAENRNVGQVSRLVKKYSVGKNVHGPREETCGFEQYPSGESSHAARLESVCVENTSKGHFSFEMRKSSELEAKRKENPCLSSDECCDEIFDVKKRNKGHQHQLIWPHIATGAWNITREQGNKLLQSRFHGDCLYICDFPSCIHSEEKRNYRLFRGIFKNFKNFMCGGILMT